MPATPNAVRVGALRGRCSTWCSRWSPVIQRSTNGHAPRSANITPGNIAPGKSMFQLHVCPKNVDSQAGMIRNEPSRNPIYQSGCEPAVTSEGLYGPYCQTALTSNRALMTTMKPKTMKKNPPALAVYTGSSGYPTTLLLVRPGPCQCVCLW